MTSTFILALLVVLAFAVPIVVIVGRAGAEEEERSEDTPHEGLDCRHCDALAVPPGLIGAVSIPRQPRGGKA